MKRVVVMYWKERADDPFEIFSNLKLLCESYPAYNYNTLNNYLSNDFIKNKEAAGRKKDLADVKKLKLKSPRTKPKPKAKRKKNNN